MDTDDNTVPFTQYLLPDGRKAPVLFETDKEHSAKGAAIRAAGFEFEIEMLTTGAVSATIVDPISEEDVDIVVASNGPTSSAAINAMIDRFHASMGARRAGDDEGYDPDEMAE